VRQTEAIWLYTMQYHIIITRAT